MEDTRLTLATLPDRLAEHPQSVIVLTNMFYAEAPTLFPKAPEHQDESALDRCAAEGQQRARLLLADPRSRRPSHPGMADGVEPEDRQPGVRHALGDGAVPRRPRLRAERSDPACDRRPAAVRIRSRARRTALPQPHLGRDEGQERVGPIGQGAGAGRPAGRRAVDGARSGDGDHPPDLADGRPVRHAAAHADEGARRPVERRQRQRLRLRRHERRGVAVHLPPARNAQRGRPTGSARRRRWRRGTRPCTSPRSTTSASARR